LRCRACRTKIPNKLKQRTNKFYM